MKKYSDTELIRKTIDIAQFNASLGFGGGPFGAIIVKEGEIISSCGNSVTLNNDPTAHAEVNAIRDACSKLKTFDLSGTTLYTSCEPCPMCLAAAYWARVDKIYFAADRHDAEEAGFSDALIYNEFTLPLEERSVAIEQINTEDKVLPFTTWKENDKKTLY